MASSREYLDFVLEQLEGISGIDYKKMFGEYLIYINNKPAIMVCDNTRWLKSSRSCWSSCRERRTSIPMRAQRCIWRWTLKTTRSRGRFWK